MATSLLNLDTRTGKRGEILQRLVAAALDTLREVLPKRLVAVYVEPHFEELAVARIHPVAAPAPVDGYHLELRFASWLTVLDVPRIQTVPTYLSAWLPLSKALVVPLIVNGHHRGAIVSDAAKLSHQVIEPIEQLAREISERLAEFERQAPQGIEAARDRFVHSVRRIKFTE